MNNPIHTHTLELDITCAGQTKTHELRVMYSYYPGDPGVYKKVPYTVCYMEQISPSVPAQVEIHDIKEFILYETPDCKTTLWHIQDTLISQYIFNSPEHMSGIEQRILEELE